MGMVKIEDLDWVLGTILFRLNQYGTGVVNGI